MTPSSVLQPETAADGYPAEFATARLGALAACVRVLGPFCDRQLIAEAADAVELLQTSTPTAREDAFLHPFTGLVQAQLLRAAQAKDPTLAEVWLREVPRIAAAAAVADDAAAGGALALPPSGDGVVWLPGCSGGLAGVEGSVKLELDGSTCRIRTDDGSDVRVSYDDLRAWSPASPCLALVQPMVAGTHVELARRPWLNGVLRGQLRINSSLAERIGGMTTVCESDRDRRALDRAFGTLAELAPDLAVEALHYVRTVCPFSGSGRSAFTNTVLQGAVFLKPPFEDELFLIERLVHESAHLRLNVVMTVHPLHTEGWTATVPSPFKAGPRPIPGLLHGVFVFTRVARVLRAEASAQAGRRHGEVVAMVVDGLRLIDEHVELTALGRAVVEEIRQEVEGPCVQASS